MNAAKASYSYTLSPTGNRTGAVESSGRTLNWTYDNIYRLTNEAISLDPHSVNGSVGYGLDPVGNRLSQASSLSAIPSGSYTYDADDRMLATETYDANGNTLVTGARAFTYDFENRLKTMTNSANGATATIVYDADGNRVAKTVNGVTTRYLVDDLNPTGYAQVVEEVTNGAVTRQYTYGLQRISQTQQIANTWTPSFYGYDGAGTARLLTDATGTVTDTYDYDAWGNTVNTTGSTPNVYLYRGEQYDSDLGLYYLRARYFNPLTGRFLTRDADSGRLTNPATLHRYLYGNGNPISFVDPSGRSAGALALPRPPPSEYLLLLTISVVSVPAIYATGQAVRCWWVDTVDELRGAANAALLGVEMLGGSGGGGGSGGSGGGAGAAGGDSGGGGTMPVGPPGSPVPPRGCTFVGEQDPMMWFGPNKGLKTCAYWCGTGYGVHMVTCWTYACTPCPDKLVPGEGGHWWVPRDQQTGECKDI